MSAFRINFNFGPTIGLGHYSRSKILAKELEKFGAVSLCGCDDCGNMPRLPVKLTTRTISIYPADNIAKVEIFDGRLFSDKDYIRVREAGGKCVIIDDFGYGSFSADLILCHQPLINHEDYCITNSAQILTGPAIALVDPVFYSVRRDRPAQEPRKIFVSFGGSDPLNLTDIILRVLMEMRDLTVYALVGPYMNRSAIANSETSRIKIVHNAAPSEIADIIKDCDVGIVSASTVAMECCAANLPLLLFATTPDQILAEQRLSNAMLASSGGLASSLSQQAIRFKVHSFIDDYALIPKLVNACAAAFQPIGVCRAAVAIQALIQP